MRMRYLTLAIVLAAAVTLPGVAAAQIQSGKALHEYGEMVDYPMLFPVADGASYTYFWDTFWAPRTGDIHHATDIMAPKMTPVIAPNDGRIGYVNWSSDGSAEFPNPERCCNLTIDFDDGWSTWFIHLNNDTPGTDDGKAWGIAPGIRPGVRVTAGQLVGWVGDSGNAEETGPHLHFELRDPENTIVNPYEALVAAPRLDMTLTCLGAPVTLRGTDGADVLEGTDGDDVIHGLAGNDTIDGMGGNDLICGGDGNDTITGSGGGDRLSGGNGSDVLDGGPRNDRVYGNKGDDLLLGSTGNDLLDGGPGNDTLVPGDGADQAFGGGGRDSFTAGAGVNTMWGGAGKDLVDYRSAPSGAAVDLGEGIGRGIGTDTLHDIERILGSDHADLLIGNDAANVFRGLGGDDTLIGGDGNDRLIGGKGRDEIDGGAGVDYCVKGETINCEPADS
ncbi:MAG: peptidoglycan DD-metalloendopeptidase family protein [Actinobacteria bacterium]|nr:peptidoglycan DD-metalloendopeptidase family protein [Actinomycetota bacterium]MBU1494801.1 peptidoglycan DD-metalloendopeptidase family protein [Actinomycetota bacterium]